MPSQTAVLAVLGAEAAAAEAPAFAPREALRPADVGAVALPHAWPPVPVALRLAYPRLGQLGRSHHLPCYRPRRTNTIQRRRRRREPEISSTINQSNGCATEPPDKQRGQEGKI